MFRHISVRIRIITAFSVVLACTLGLGLFAINRLATVNASLSDLATHWLPASHGLGEAGQSFELARFRQLQLTTVPESERPEIRDSVNQELAQLSQAIEGSTRHLTSPEERAQAEKIRAELKTYMANSTHYAGLIDTGDMAAAQAYFSQEMRTQARELRNYIQEARAYQVEAGEKAAAYGMEQGATARTLILIALCVTALCAALIGFLMVRAVSVPIARMSDVMKVLSSGQTEVKVPHLGERNEIGQMAAAVEVFRDGLIRNRALEAEAARAREDAEHQRRQAMRDLAADFEGAIGGVVEMVSSAATEMQATAAQLSASAQESSAKAQSVSAAAEQAGSSVTSVAGSAEELGASISEISRQVRHSLSKAREAVGEAEATYAIVNELSGAAGRITSIVDMISSIASQTNLLALNATIESARAGEAGKGFAVVAAEVKTLATQTAHATTEINQQIAGIQATTEQAVRAIENISQTIRIINESSATIAAAVEQQGAATSEIVLSVTQASTGAIEVTQNITGVARMAEETGTGASQVLSASSELAQQAAKLQAQVNGFLAQVRAA
ncbi:HAMP domain-containing methyl-accepting chemotaxis protein [Asticcacaulis excentricus]|uniref:Methyl-accepting chemotaxis protein n=1 Tax=Asticcacaulis excentricus TaxID=78587 RepID=A0A3G9G968_9CAUL|nr:methyl-accepting chemotaxis protein [Asticcacaulis excentricus]BBF80899.1 methyl-accepting chemotaxis protein [Asticcacaulis excentricus]